MKRIVKMAVRVSILLALFVSGIVVNAMVRGGGPRGLSSLRPVPVLGLLAPPPPDPAALVPHHEEEATAEAEEDKRQRTLGEMAGQMYLVPKPFSVEELSELQRKLEKARTHYEERTAAVEVMLADLERVRDDLEFRREELEQLRKEIEQARAEPVRGKGAQGAAGGAPETTPAKAAVSKAEDPESSASPKTPARRTTEITPAERSRLKALAKIYEATKPQSAAAQLAALPPLEAAKILSVMRARASAKVLSAMEVERAAEMVNWMRRITTTKGAGQEARR